MSRRRPLLIGITGGIGSGKSLICEIFSYLGAPIYNADDRAKWLMNNEESLIKNIKDAFGKDSYTPESTLNRTYLANAVFNDDGQLKTLNSLVHPAVGKDFKKWVMANKDYNYLIKEAALIFEAGSEKGLDYVITVSAPESVRTERVLKRDPFRSPEQVKSIMKKQMSDEQRKDLADFNLINDNEHMVIPQVLELHHRFTSSATHPNVFF